MRPATKYIRNVWFGIVLVLGGTKTTTLGFFFHNSLSNKFSYRGDPRSKVFHSQQKQQDKIMADSHLPPSLSTPTTFKIYPIDNLSRLKEEQRTKKNGGIVKTVHFVRHAEGTHNVNREYKDIKNLDARLTEKGIQQCTNLANNIISKKSSQFFNINNNDNNNDILVCTSTMTRCIQTALYSFPWLTDNPKVPFIAHEGIRETVNYNCDRRRSLTELRQEFSHRVDFETCCSNVDNDDPIWNYYKNRLGQDWDGHMESSELHVVVERTRAFLEFVMLQRSETEIIVCTHSALLRCVMNWDLPGGVPRLMPQRSDDRPEEIKNNDVFPLFEYVMHDNDNGDNEKALFNFGEYMRSDYENCELRSFCMVVE